MPLISTPMPQSRKCEQGVLWSYVDMFERHEAPHEFHMWSCMAVIGALLGRKCYYSQGLWNIYPNLYVILVGESGSTKKSTCITQAAEIMRTAEPDKKYFHDKITTERLLSSLAKVCSDTGVAEAMLFADELSVFLNNTKFDDTLLKNLTTLYDCKEHFSYETMTRGEEKMDKAFFAKLCGSTEEWLKNSLPKESLGGGYFSRLILVHRAPTGRREPRPERVLPRKDSVTYQNILHDLECIANIAGEFTMSKEAQAAFDDWYVDQDPTRDAEHMMKGYHSRKGNTLIKLGMCLSASQSDSKIIEAKHFEAGLRMLAENEKWQRRLVVQMSSTEFGRDTDWVLQLIRKYQGTVGIGKGSLVSKTRHKLTKRQLQDILDVLEDSGLVKLAIGGKQGMKYKAVTDEEFGLGV